jgi:hypothetical protein
MFCGVLCTNDVRFFQFATKLFWLEWLKILAGTWHESLKKSNPAFLLLGAIIVCEWSGNVKELWRDVRTKDDMSSSKNNN